MKRFNTSLSLRVSLSIMLSKSFKSRSLANPFRRRSTTLPFSKIENATRKTIFPTKVSSI